MAVPTYVIIVSYAVFVNIVLFKYVMEFLRGVKIGAWG